MLEYIAGAVAFNNGEAETALNHFKAIDALPAEQRRLREVAAAYMQARIYQLLENFAAARTAFQATRERAVAGAPDPMGLGVASLGDEARLDLIEAGLMEAAGFTPSDEDRANAGATDRPRRRLYAEQAARGSKMALLSLREVASPAGRQRRRCCAGRSEIRDGAAAARRLRIASEAADWTMRAASPRRRVDSRDRSGARAAAPRRPARRSTAWPRSPTRPAATRPPNRLTAKTDRPLGLWVRAKLALRHGDRAAAVAD